MVNSANGLLARPSLLWLALRLHFAKHAAPLAKRRHRFLRNRAAVLCRATVRATCGSRVCRRLRRRNRRLCCTKATRPHPNSVFHQHHRYARHCVRPAGQSANFYFGRHRRNRHPRSMERQQRSRRKSFRWIYYRRGRLHRSANSAHAHYYHHHRAERRRLHQANLRLNRHP